jgi:hypothetical protein
LTPNARYQTSCIETKNPDAVAGTTYSLSINDVKFFAFVEKLAMPPAVRELGLLEYQVQSRPWSSQINFTVPPFTEALTFFVQDMTAGDNPMIPPSMFKCLNNSDLRLKSILVSYAGITKPSTSWESYFYDGKDQFQQRYINSYKEAGRNLDVLGCESYAEYLNRGPFYHFSFPRAVNDRATQISVTTSFDGLPAGPTSGIAGTSGKALLFCVCHYRVQIALTQSGGSVVRADVYGD